MPAPTGIENDGYQIIPARDAQAIHNLDIVSDQNEKIVCEAKLELGDDDEVVFNDVADDSEEEPDWLSPGTIERLSLKKTKWRWFLNITGNFTKIQLQCKYGSLFNAWRTVIMALLLAYLCFTFGVGKLKTDSIKTMIVLDQNLPFTTVHDAIWQLKWVLAYVLGTFYHGSGHLEGLLRELRLTSCSIAKSKQNWLRYKAVIVIMIIILPTLNHAWKLYDLLETQKIAHVTKNGSIWCCVLFFVFRVVTVPSFCVVTVVLYFIKVQLDTLGRILKSINVNLGEAYAEREIKNVKKMIRKTDIKLKWYLLCHVVLILFTTFFGILSCVERIEFKFEVEKHAPNKIEIEEFTSPHGNVTKLRLNIADFKRELMDLSKETAVLGTEENKPRMKVNEEEIDLMRIKVVRLQQLNVKLMRLALLNIANTQMKQIVPSVRNTTMKITSNSGATSMQVRFLEKSRPVRVVIESITSLTEVLILFLVPLWLLAWHKRAILRITDEIYDLDVEDQRRMNFLMDCKQTQKGIVKKLRSMRGVTIFGMEVSFYKAGFVAILAPFVTVTMHGIFKHFGFY